MNRPLASPSRETATGVVTNGEGQRTTAHLNLTRSMADVFARKTVSDFEAEKKAATKRQRQMSKPNIAHVPLKGQTICGV